MASAIAHLYRGLRDWIQGEAKHDRLLELVGTGLAREVAKTSEIRSLHDVEFRVYSQFGDDGIIQWLIHQMPSIPRRFVEFGVEDYTEATTRFLMVNNAWAGLVIDGSSANIRRLKSRPWYWRHDLRAKACFLTRENVDRVVSEWANGRPVGLLHIDVDGNDYWLWEAIHSIHPEIAIVEFNALFGPEREISIPYRADFSRLRSHYSGQYSGASIAALAHLGKLKGYALIGTNAAGNNAYFVRSDMLTSTIHEVSPQDAWVKPSFRDSRNRSGGLTFLGFDDRQAMLRGMPVVNVATGEVEEF